MKRFPVTSSAVHHGLMVALTPDDQNKILGPQAELEKALAIWSSSGREDTDFGRLIPFVDDLVDAKQEIMDRHAAARKAVVSRVGGGILSAVAVIVPIVVLASGGPKWLLVVAFVGLLVGIYLFVLGGNRARIT